MWHVWGEEICVQEFSWERDHLEYLGVGSSMILKWTIKNLDGAFRLDRRAGSCECGNDFRNPRREVSWLAEGLLAYFIWLAMRVNIIIIMLVMEYSLKLMSEPHHTI
jgi:hypothetical protein